MSFSMMIPIQKLGRNQTKRSLLIKDIEAKPGLYLVSSMELAYC